MRLAEPVSGISHLVGVGLAIAGLVLLLVLADGALAIVALSVYGASLILLYLVSTLYHLFPWPRVRAVFGKLDHSSIYILIAGTYTPVCLLAMPPAWGWTIFGIEWALAATGIALTNTLPKRAARAVDGALYIVMGWLALVALEPLQATFGAAALAWLLAGGIIYTVGALIYATKRPRLAPGIFGSHELWHLLVLAGSVAHFVFVARYVVPVA